MATPAELWTGSLYMICLFTSSTSLFMGNSFKLELNCFNFYSKETRFAVKYVNVIVTFISGSDATNF